MSLLIPIGNDLKEKFNIKETRFYKSEEVLLNVYNMCCNEILRRIREQLKN